VWVTKLLEILGTMSFSFFSKHNGLMFAASLRRRSEPGLLAQYMQVSTFDPPLGSNFLRCCVLHLLVAFEIGHCSEGQTENSFGQIRWEVLCIWLD